ncbi:MAG: hypothetical protein Q9222_006059 [Ikaeria aurantiellina]
MPPSPTKKKPPLTHFLCLPLTSSSAVVSQWQASLKRFSADISPTSPPLSSSSPSTSTATSTATPPSSNILPSTGSARKQTIPLKAVRPVGTLHLTIGVMSLGDKGAVERAVGCLKGAVEEVWQGGERADRAAAPVTDLAEDTNTTSPPPSTTSPLTLAFAGLESMHSPRSTSFLYVPPEDRSGRLYPFCEGLKKRFVREGLMVDEKRGLRLHATVLNTIYAGKVFIGGNKSTGGDGEREAEVVEDRVQGNEEGDGDGAEEQRPSVAESKRGKKGKRKKQVVKFDARELLERYKECVWARDVEVEKVAICEMGAKEVVDESTGEVVGEEYREVASVRLA